MRTASMKRNYFPLWTECPRRRREQAAALERLLPNGSQTPRVSAARPRAGLACVRPSPADMPHGAKRPARICTRPPTADRLAPPGHLRTEPLHLLPGLMAAGAGTRRLPALLQ